MLMEEWFSDGFAVQVPAGTSVLDAEMQVPPGAAGLIILSHAGSRARGLQRVQNLAEHFTKEGFGILVMDLLTEEEEEIGKQGADYGPRLEGAACFDAEMLAERLCDSLEWVRDLPEAQGLSLGLFGAGPGAWAAFAAAAARPGEVSALVAAGLTPADLRPLARVRSPTLLLAGDGEGPEAVLAKACFNALPGRKRLECVPTSPKGWEDARANEKLARLACQWFEQYLQ
jgi:putative phosphoribosyl transferase